MSCKHRYVIHCEIQGKHNICENRFWCFYCNKEEDKK